MQIFEKILQEIEYRKKVLGRQVREYEDCDQINDARNIDYQIRGLNIASGIIRFHTKDDKWFSSGNERRSLDYGKRFTERGSECLYNCKILQFQAGCCAFVF